MIELFKKESLVRATPSARNLGVCSPVSRRHFLQALSASVAGNAFARCAFFGNSPEPFEEFPASRTGITWAHSSGRSSAKFLPETTGAGCAFLDYDNDGWMDIYLVNSGHCDFFRPNPPLTNALYRNNRDGTFTDVTGEARVDGGGYGMGAAVGDYNADGFPDLYVTQYGRSILYRNNGNGTFTDVTEKAGVAAPGWASSAVWFDYDNDGRLDLFVCSFVKYQDREGRLCGLYGSGETSGAHVEKQHYCVPRVYDPAPCWLFHNNGDGTFTDVSRESGIAAHLGKAWGVVATDVNNDGWMDLFVSNDTLPNFLFANRGGGRFEEIGMQASVAYSEDGRERSGMGVDSADLDEDGWMDLCVTNLDQEKFSVYRNNQDETFDDVALSLTVAQASRLMSGWGVKFLDYDNDGNLDLFCANGHPDDLIEERSRQVTYRERFLLFKNAAGKFKDVSADSGTVFGKPFSARGVALGDINNDGGVDILVSINDGPPVLLRNKVGAQNHWLGLKLVGSRSNRDAVGARVTYQSGDLKRSRMKVGGGGFLSSHDPRMVLGLGTRRGIDWLEVRWPQPSLLVERFRNLPVDRYITIVEGDGKWK